GELVADREKPVDRRRLHSTEELVLCHVVMQIPASHCSAVAEQLRHVSHLIISYREIYLPIRKRLSYVGAHLSRVDVRLRGTYFDSHGTQRRRHPAIEWRVRVAANTDWPRFRPGCSASSGPAGGWSTPM